jgi:hypothetical protein
MTKNHPLGMTFILEFLKAEKAFTERLLINFIA